jgi:hypothetical protein
MSPTRRAPEPLPEVLQTVTLVAQPTETAGGVETETKVLDVESSGLDDATVVLSRQLGTDGLTGRPVAMVWTGLLGRVECPVALRTGRRDYGPVWLARATGRAVRTQRRAYFRARMHMPVQLAWIEERDGRPVERRLDCVAVDLSEGGVLATIRGPLPSPGTTVTATVTLDGESLDQTALVVRHAVFAGGGMGIAVAFVDPALYGDRIRRAAFEAERRALLNRR